MKKYSDISLWKNLSVSEWTDWKWQISHSINTLEQLEQVIDLTPEEKLGVAEATKALKMRISPHIALMIANGEEEDTLRRQFIPSINEMRTADLKGLFNDVNDDDGYSPVKGLVHRYPTKVLVFPSNFCGCYCRYCFRRKLKRDVEDTLKKEDYIRIFDYLREHPQINEVIFSGGDPLVVEDETFKYILSHLAEIPTIKIVRFHTRMIITVPYRISDELINLLNEYKSRFAIYMVIHIDTLREFSSESQIAVEKLVNNGIMCFASCPLLHKINDNEETLKSLWNGLVEHKVKPYYLFQSDPVQGLGHFMVSLSRGLEITRNLYDNMSGLAMPLYCFNVPNGGGHILITYPYIRQIAEHEFELTNFEGKVTNYYETIWDEDINTL
jgi:lysine 2,3-aminomutase